MPNRYRVNYEGLPFAMAHVLPHPRYEGHVAISVIPISKKGGLENESAGITLDAALYGHFPDTKPEIEAIMEIVASAGIEPGKVEIRPVGRR